MSSLIHHMVFFASVAGGASLCSTSVLCCFLFQTSDFAVTAVDERKTFAAFGRTYDVMDKSIWNGAPLTSFELEAAFRHYFGDKVTHEEWIEPGQLEMQSKHEVVHKLVAALKRFRSPDVAGELPVYTHAKAQLAPQTANSPGIQKAPPSPPSETSYPSAPTEQPHHSQAHAGTTDNQVSDQSFQPQMQSQAQLQNAQGYLQRPGYSPAYPQGYQQPSQGQGQASSNYAPNPQEYGQARGQYPAVSILTVHSRIMYSVLTDCSCSGLYVSCEDNVLSGHTERYSACITACHCLL